MDRVPRQTEAQQNRLHTQNLLESTHDRNRTARIEGQGLLVEGGFDGLLGCLIGGQVGRRDVGRAAVQEPHVDLHAAGRNGAEIPLEELGDLTEILIRHQPHRDLGRRTRRNDRLGSLLDITAPDAVHVERRAHARTLHGRITRFTRHVADVQRPLVVGQTERRLVERTPFGGRQFAHVVVESGNRHAPLVVDQRSDQPRQHVGWIGHRTAEKSRMQILVRSRHLYLHIS